MAGQIYTNLESMAGTNLVIDGTAANHYGIDGSKPASESGYGGFYLRNAGQSLTVQHVGSATIAKDTYGNYSYDNTGKVTDTSITMGNSITGFGSGNIIASPFTNQNITINDSVFSGNNSNTILGFYSTGSVQITNSKFINNTVSGNIIATTSGDGISSITNSVFANNTQTNPMASCGAIIFTNGKPDTKISLIDNVDIVGNSASAIGAGSGYYVTIQNSLIERNTGKQGGAFNVPGSLIDLVDNVKFLGNKATDTGMYSGGAIYAGGTTISKVVNSLFSGNEAAGNGGAVAAGGSTLLFEDTNFNNNISAVGGGAIFSGGSTIKINANAQDVLFTNNYSGEGSVVSRNEDGTYNASGPNMNDMLLAGGDIYLNANTNKSITFNGTLQDNGEGLANIRINSDGTIKGGNYIFNNEIGNSHLYLYNNANVTLGANPISANTYGKLNVWGLISDENGGSINSQNNHIDSHSINSYVNLGSDLKFAIDADLDGSITGSGVASADSIAFSNPATAYIYPNSGSILIDAIHLLSTTDADEVQIQLVTDDVSKKLYTVSNAILGNITYATGVDEFDADSITFNNQTGILTLHRFVEGDATLDDVRVAGKNYITNAHATYDNLVTTRDDAHPDSVVINGTTYYFKANEATASKTQDLRNLVAVGTNAVKEVGAGDDYIFSVGGKYYTYDYKFLPTSVYAISDASADDYNYMTYSANASGVLTPSYYNIELRPNKFANGRVFFNSTATEPTSYEPVYSENTFHNLTGVAGAINVVLPHVAGDDTTPQNNYFTYTYAPSGARIAQKADITDNINSGYFYNIDGDALTVLSDDGYSVNADFIRNTTGTNAMNVRSGAFVDQIRGTFIGNGNGGYNSALNISGTVNDVIADFVNNRDGLGAINISGLVNSISGNFIANEGGAIRKYHGTSYTAVTGKFIGNTASSDGAAIYVSGNRIGNISGDFINNSSSGSAGAVYIAGANSAAPYTYNITGDFIGNKSLSTGPSAGGGAIMLSLSHMNNIVGNFINNSSQVNGGAIFLGSSSTLNSISGDYAGNSAASSGGAIYLASSSINSVNGNFSNNQAAYGGAIYLGGAALGSVVNSEFINNIAGNGGAISNGGSNINLIENTKFIGNKATTDLASGDGGALYGSGSAASRIANSLFVGNEAENTGGAIFAGGATFTIEDTNFNNNIAKVNGGALYLAGCNTSINANAKDVVFANNYAGSDAQLTKNNDGTYTASGSTLNDIVANGNKLRLNANADKSITFNGSILDGAGYITLSVNENDTINGGQYIFNNAVDFSQANSKISLYNGANIKLGSVVLSETLNNYGSLNASAFTVDDVAGSSIDSQNGNIDSNALGAVTLGSNLSLSIDAMLAGNTQSADSYSINSIEDGDTVFNISSVKVLNDSTFKHTRADVITTTSESPADIYARATGSGNAIATGLDGTYTYAYDNTDGRIYFNRTDIVNLLTAVKDGNAPLVGTDPTYTLSADEDVHTGAITYTSYAPVPDALGAMAGAKLVVDGTSANKYKILGSHTEDEVTTAYGGIEVGSTQELTFKNIGDVTGFNTAGVINGGTLNVINSKFTSAVENNNTFNLDGTNNINTVTGANGVTNVQTGTTTFTTAFSQKGLTVADGAVAINDGTMSITNTLTNNGTLTNNNELNLSGADMANAGTIDGDGTANIIGKVTNTGDGNITGNDIVIASAGELVTSASKISDKDNNIVNDGTLTLNGGTLSDNVAGTEGVTTGHTDITGAVDFADGDVVISQQVNVLGTGALTANTSNLDTTVSNEAVEGLILTGGTLTHNVTGAGSTKITGDVEFSATYSEGVGTYTTVSNGIVVANGGQLTTATQSLTSTADIKNEGTLVFNNQLDGAIGSNITGDGTGAGKVEISAGANAVISTVHNIEDNAVEVKSGTFHIANGASLDGTTTVTVDSGAVLNTIDNIINDYTAQIELKDGSKVLADIDAATIDTFSSEAGGTVTITDLNVNNIDGSVKEQMWQFASDGTTVTTIPGGVLVQVADGTVAIKGSGLADGKVIVSQSTSTGLNGAVDVSGAISNYTYNMFGDENVNQTESTLGHIKDNFTIEGNGYKIIANDGTKGIIVDAGHSLTVNNATFNNFDTDNEYIGIITNKGTLNVNDSTFNAVANGENIAIYNDAGATLISDPSTYHARVVNHSDATFSGDVFENIASAGKRGGAILNYSDLTVQKEIDGSDTYYPLFTGNSAMHGGAIYSDSMTIASTTNISDATFYKNTASNNGGAFYNEGTAVVNGSTFGDGTALNANRAVNGGAIFNTGSLTINGGTFNGNIVTGKGGAIYSTGDVSINSTVAQGSVSFVENVIEGVDPDEANDIYMAGTIDNVITLNLDAVDDTNTISLGGSVDGQYYDVNINTVNAGTVSTGIIANAKDIVIGGGDVTTSTITADSLEVQGGELTAGTVTITDGSNAGVINGTGDMTINGVFDNTGGFIDGKNIVVTSPAGGLTTDGVDDVTTPTVGITGTIDNSGDLSITGGKIVNTISGTGSLTTDGNVEITDAVAVTQNDLTVGSGTLTNGGTLTVNDSLTNGGTIANNNILNLNGANIQNSGAINGSGATNINGKVNNTGSITGNNIAIGTTGELITNASNISDKDHIIINDGALTLTNGGTLSDTVNSSTSTTAHTDIKGAVDFNNTTTAINQKINILAGGALTAHGSNIGGEVDNEQADGLILTGGNLAHNVTGGGSTQLTGDVTILNATKSIAQDIHIESTGSLTANAGSIGGNVVNKADDGLELTGGDLVHNVTGVGSTVVDGTVTMSDNTKSIAQDITIQSGSLTASANSVGGDVTNTQANGLVLNGGDLVNDVTGAGTTKVTGTVTMTDNTKSIAQNITVESGSLTASADSIKGNVNNTGANSLVLTGGTLGSASNNYTVSSTAGTGTVKVQTGDVTIASGSAINENIDIVSGSLTANAGSIGGDVSNASDDGLVLTGGSFGYNVTGDGTTLITDGDVVMANPAKSIAQDITIETTGSLTASANSIGGDVTNKAADGLTLTGGTLAKDVTGAGSTVVDGTVNIANTHYIEQNIRINSGAGKSLESNVAGIRGDVENNGLLTIYSQDDPLTPTTYLNNDVTGTGKTVIQRNVTVNGDVETEVQISSYGSNHADVTVIAGNNIGSATQDITIDVNNKLTMRSATDLQNDVTNDGTLVLNSGNLNHNVVESTNTGKTIIDDGEVTNNAVIDTKVEITNDGHLNTETTGLTDPSDIKNDGIITYTNTVNGSIGSNITENTTGTGTVEIAAADGVTVGIDAGKTISNNALKLTSGTFDAANLADTNNDIDLSPSAGITELIANGGTLSVQDGVAANINLGNNINLTTADLKVNIDLNFMSDTADVLSGVIASGTKGISLESIRLTSDEGYTTPVDIKVADANLGDKISIANAVVSNNANVGDLLLTKNTFSATEGTSIHIEHSDLDNAITSNVLYKAFVMGDNVIDNSSGALLLGGETLSISSGTNDTLTGTSAVNDGIELNGNELTLNNMTVTGFDNAIINTVDDGVVNLNNVTMTGNVTADIVNDQTLNARGTTTLDTVLGNGTTNALDGTTTSQVLFSQDNLNIGDTSVDPNTDAKFINNGNLDVDNINVNTANSEFENSNGAIAAINNKFTNKGILDNDGTITGAGDIDNQNYVDNSGTIETAIANTVDDALIDNSGTISGTVGNVASATVNNNAGGTITGDITNHGALNNYEADTTKGILANVTNDGTFTNSGNVGGAGKTVTNNANGVIDNTGLISSSLDNKLGGTVNTIASGVTGGVSNDGELNLNDGVAHNQGTIGSNITGDGVTNVFDSIKVANGKSVEQGTINIGDSTLGTDASLENDGTLTADYLNVNTEDSSFTNNAGKSTTINNKLNNVGTVDNDGTITGVGDIDNQNYVDNSGTIETAIANTVDDALIDNSGTISGTVGNVASATVNNNAGGTITGDITNHGALNNYEADTTKGILANVTNDGTFTNSGNVGGAGKTVTNNANGVIDNTGLISSSLDNKLGGTVNTIASGVTGGVSNDGELNLNDGVAHNQGTIGSNITGDGVTNVFDSIKVANGKSVEQGTINIGDSTLGTDASLENDGTLTADYLNVNTEDSSFTNNAGKTTTINNKLANAGTVENKGTITGGLIENANTLLNESTGSIEAAVKNFSGAVLNNKVSATDPTEKGSITGVVDNYGNVINSGDITTLNNKAADDSDPSTASAGQVDNMGTIGDATNGAGAVIDNIDDGTINTLVNDGASATAPAGVVNSAAGSILTSALNNGVLNLDDGDLSPAQSTIVAAITGDGHTNIFGDVTNASDTFEQAGGITVQNSGSEYVANSLTNQGTITANVDVEDNADFILDNDSHTIGDVTLEGDKSRLVIIDDGDLTGDLIADNDGQIVLYALDEDTNLSQISGDIRGTAGDGNYRVFASSIDYATVSPSGNVATLDKAIAGASKIDIDSYTDAVITDDVFASNSTAPITVGDESELTLQNNSAGDMNVNNSIANRDEDDSYDVIVENTDPAQTTNLNNTIAGADTITVDSGTMNIKAGDDTSTGARIGEAEVDITDGATAKISTTAGTMTINNDVVGEGTGSTLELNGNAGTPTTASDPGTIFTVASGNTIENATLIATNGQLNLPTESVLTNGTELQIGNGATLNTMNGSADKYFTNTTFDDGSQVKFDVDVLSKVSDRFENPQQGPNDGVVFTDLTLQNLDKILVNNTDINLVDLTNLQNVSVGEELLNKKFQAMTAIRRMEATIDQTGMLNIHPSSGRNNYKDFNPSVVATDVGAQIGGYLTQLQSYDEAFRNMDMYMLMTQEQRQAMKLRNKYASAGSSSFMTFDPNQGVYQQPGVWLRPYANFEKVGLKHGPKVSNTAYGSYFGGESELAELGNGWDGMFGAYIGYNGSHQNYDGVGIYQNGGTLGVTGMLYKGNFFTGITANTGANIADASTTYGNDDFYMLMAGIASKTGYNWELAKGKFIIQPSWTMSYSFVNAFDHKNPAGVKINTKPLNAVNLEPGIKIIGNLKNGWQPYAGFSVVWNIMDKTDFHANDIALPEMSVKPFVKYGVGLRKVWGDKFTGYLQAFFTGGGRNGVGLSAGFKWSLGKDSDKYNSATQGSPKVVKSQRNVYGSIIQEKPRKTGKFASFVSKMDGEDTYVDLRVENKGSSAISRSINKEIKPISNLQNKKEVKMNSQKVEKKIEKDNKKALKKASKSKKSK